MMKKVLLVVLCLMLAASVSMAQTSGPSNVAGYVKITCGGNTPLVGFATPFGLPFKFWDVTAGVPQYGVESTKPSDIVGDQANPGNQNSGDRILSQEGGLFAYRNIDAANAWTGTLEDNSGMLPGKPFWYVNRSGAPRNLVLAGEVDNAGNYGTFVVNAPSVAGGARALPYGWRDSRNVPVDSLQLLASGFTGGTTSGSDQILAQLGGLVLRYRTDVVPIGWDYGGAGSPFTYVAPGKAYWIINKHFGNTWNYNYVGVPALPSTMRTHDAVVTSTNRSSNDTKKATVRATTSAKKSTSSKSGSKIRTNK